MARDLGVVDTLLAPVGRAGAPVLGGWGLALLLGGIWAVRRAPPVALLVLLPGCLLTSCTPPVTLAPAPAAPVSGSWEPHAPEEVSNVP